MTKIRYNFIPQKGKNPKIVGTGVLTMDHGEAVFFSGDAGADSKVLGVLEKPEVVFLNSSGILLKGYVSAGFERDGTERLNNVKWYCTFITEEVT